MTTASFDVPPASPAATLVQRLGTTPMPASTPAGPLWTNGQDVMLAGRLLNREELSGLCALLLGQALTGDHPAWRSPVLAPLRGHPRCEVRIWTPKEGSDAPEQDGPLDTGVALNVSGTWYLGRLISQASGSCAWYEELLLGGRWIANVTLYPEYNDDDTTAAAVQFNGASPLVRELLPEHTARWDDAQRRAQFTRLLEAHGAFLPVGGGHLHLSFAMRGGTHVPPLRLVAAAGVAHVSVLLPAPDAHALAQAIEDGAARLTHALSYDPQTASLNLSGPGTHWTGESPAQGTLQATVTLALPPGTAHSLALLIRRHMPRPCEKQDAALPF